uniref:C-type lectin domain-containing protein n=1 Tax=Oreochromis aureus TaxID=47969 RepID=A0A668S743_OREAU
IYFFFFLSETQLRDKDEGSLHSVLKHFLSHLNHTNMHIAFFHLNDILCSNIFKDEPCSKCGEGWEHHGRKCYYFSVSKSSWTESRGECRAKGGDLVKIDSREELKDIMNYPQDKFWFGLTDSAEEGRWLWVDGSLIYWGYNEPDDWKGDYPDGEDCGRMGVKGETSDLNSWFDASCNVAHRSICEKPEITGQPTKASVQI